VRSKGRIKVAYLSSSFNRHPTGWQIAELFELLDREQLRYWGFPMVPMTGAISVARLVKAFEPVSRRRSAQRPGGSKGCSATSTSILPSTSKATPSKRAQRYWRTARPRSRSAISASLLRWVSTSSTISWADRVVLPFEQQPHYGERIVHLPDSYWVNDSKRGGGNRSAVAACGRLARGWLRVSAV